MDTKKAEDLLNSQIVPTPFKLDLEKVGDIADEIEKLENGLDHFLPDRSNWKLTNIPKMFRHAFIRNYIVRMSEITDRVQWFHTVLNRNGLGTVYANPDVPTEMMSTDPFGEHVAMVPELRKAVYDAKVLVHYIKKEYDNPSIDDHIAGPWEIFDTQAWKENLYALYCLYSRIVTLPVLSPVLQHAAYYLTKVCECIGWDKSFENTVLKDSGDQGFIMKFWDEKGSMVLEHCDQQVYFTEEEKEQIELEKQAELKRKAEEEAAEQRRQLVSDFVERLYKYINKSKPDRISRKIFTPELFEQFRHPDSETVKLILAIKKFVDLAVDGMNADARAEMFMVILNVGENIHIFDKVKEDVDATIRLIRFFTKHDYKACGLPLMEIIDGTESDEVLAACIRANHEIQLSL